MRKALLLLIASVVGSLPLFAAQDPLAGSPPSYREAMIGAMRSFTSRDFATARAMVEKADTSFQQTPVSLNILGAISIEERKFDEGRDFCLKALKIDPKFFPARFNLAEIPFVQAKYSEARAMFEQLQEDEPKDDLLKFRIFLTHLLDKNEAEAKEHLDAIPLINETPISFYANAAWHFAYGNEKDARDWIASGLRTFPPARHINFIEVFYDLGWLKRGAANDPKAQITNPEAAR
jgi:tetratricopeptide (TPR) repeat protein